MKYIKYFKESIINYKSVNLSNFEADILKEKLPSFEKIKEIGNKYNIEVVDYDTFYRELPNDQQRKDAPKDVPAFAMVNRNTNNPRLVLNVKYLTNNLVRHCLHMLKHENIHIGQIDRKINKSIGEFMGDVKDMKSYFSNKDEVMAFSQSISDMIMQQNPKSISDAISKIKKNPLYMDISRHVDKNILNRYKKYIYLYIENEFKN